MDETCNDTAYCKDKHSMTNDDNQNPIIGHQSLAHAFQTYLNHDREEQLHWEDVCQAYRQYATFALCSWSNHRQRIDRLPDDQKKLLPPGLRSGTIESEERARQFHEAAIRNQFLLDCILRHAGMPHSQESQQQSLSPSSASAQNVQSTQRNSSRALLSSSLVADGQISKVSSVLKSLARDWSLDGKGERDQAYEPILNAVVRYVPIVVGRKGDEAPRICVPGAGVGRLALELAALGYRVQGNEFSLYMLLASDFILNGGVATPIKPMSISPWLLETRNVHAHTDVTRKVMIPDVDPSAYLLQNESDVDDTPPPDFSMAAGDFVGIYGKPREVGQWDAVVCCFFLDAAPSIIEYIQILYKMLRDDGIVVNFGPLLYHWSGPAMRPDDRTVADYQSRFSYLDTRYMTSVDLCWQDVREILVTVGFELLEEKVGIRALYTADRRSMMNLAYRCIHFVAIKRKKTAIHNLAGDDDT